jgi:hypothetical protein
LLGDLDPSALQKDVQLSVLQKDLEHKSLISDPCIFILIKYKFIFGLNFIQYGTIVLQLVRRFIGVFFELKLILNIGLRL